MGDELRGNLDITWDFTCNLDGILVLLRDDVISCEDREYLRREVIWGELLSYVVFNTLYGC